MKWTDNSQKKKQTITIKKNPTSEAFIWLQLHRRTGQRLRWVGRAGTLREPPYNSCLLLSMWHKLKSLGKKKLDQTNYLHHTDPWAHLWGIFFGCWLIWEGPGHWALPFLSDVPAPYNKAEQAREQVSNQVSPRVPESALPDFSWCWEDSMLS